MAYSASLPHPRSILASLSFRTLPAWSPWGKSSLRSTLRRTNGMTRGIRISFRPVRRSPSLRVRPGHSPAWRYRLRARRNQGRRRLGSWPCVSPPGKGLPRYLFPSSSFRNASSSVLKSRAAWPTRTIRMLRIASPFFTFLSRSSPAIVFPIAVVFLSRPARF